MSASVIFENVGVRYDGRAALSDVSAAFAAGRLVRQPNFLQVLELSRVCRAGPVALLDAQVLGRDVRANSQAELLGQSLPILHSLAPSERELLTLINQPMAVTELCVLAQRVNLNREAVLHSLGLLIQRGLIQMISTPS